MNISPILLLAIGSTFAVLYGLIITIGWALTRKNRKAYHDAMGYSEVELFDLDNFQPLGQLRKIISLQNNFFVSENNDPIDLKKYNCYLVSSQSIHYPHIHKGDLILIDPSSKIIKFAFQIPDLNEYR